MPDSDYCVNLNAKVPWILALALLFGLNTFAADLPQPDPRTGSGETSLHEGGDELQVPSRCAKPLPMAFGPVGMPALPPQFLRLEISPETPIRYFRRGTTRGRAPPLS